jgi:hypothetical protein
MSGDVGFRLADRAGDEPARVLRRAFVAAVVLVFVVGLPLGTAWTLIGVVLAVAALGVELLLPRDRLVGRWHGLVGLRAAGADSGYAAVYQALREHEVPADVRPRRVRQPGGVRNGLLVRSGAHRVQVSVFPFGKDLAFGWTMWHRDFPARAVWHLLRGAMGEQPADVEPVRALAGAVHAAVLQGVAAAESKREVPLAEAFGYDVPVEDGTAPPAHVPAQPGPPLGPPGAPAGPASGSRRHRHAGGHVASPAGSVAVSPPVALGAPPPLVPGMGEVDEHTAVISPLQFSPFEFTVSLPVEVFTPDGAVVGRLEPSTRYWAVDEHPAGLVVQIAAGAALLRDRTAVRPE